MKYLSLFSGIGAPEEALTNLGIDFELVGFSEINKFSVQTYMKLHNQSEKKLLGDITKINIDALPNDIDLLTHGSPCTSFSAAGKGLGGNRGSGTESSLMWYTVDIAAKKKPKFIVWENVKNVLSKKHIHNFNEYIDTLEELGYNNYYEVLNSKDFNIPQNRDRIFVVSIRKDVDDYSFKFEEPLPQKHILNDFLDKSISIYNSPNLYIDNEYSRNLKDDPMIKENRIIKLGNYLKSDHESGRIVSVNGLYPCVKDNHGTVVAVKDEFGVRKLTSKEFWLLMGFTESRFKLAESVTSNSQLLREAGNSIVVPVLESIFKNLFKDMTTS